MLLYFWHIFPQDVFVNVLTVLWLEKFGANPAGEVHFELFDV